MGMDRRSFIKQAAVVGGATFLFPGSVLASTSGEGAKTENRLKLPGGPEAYESLKLELPKYKKINPEIDNLFKLNGQETIHGATTELGKFIRTIRFKNLTKAVEKRYNLPENILLALIMMESTGVEYLGNAGGDGGFGLSHTQPITAQAYGLRTYKNCNSLVCNGKKGSCVLNGVYQNHAKELKDFIEENRNDRAKLAEADQRLNHLYNLDMVGRMLASAMISKKIVPLEGVLLDSFESAIYKNCVGLPKRIDLSDSEEEKAEKIKENEKKYNKYLHYINKIREFLSIFSDKNYFNKAKNVFEEENKDSFLDCKRVSFEDFLNLCYKQNENFGLEYYKKLPLYELNIKK